MNVKLPFILASALPGMCSTYIGQLVRAAAAPLILCMCTCIGVWPILNIIHTLQYVARIDVLRIRTDVLPDNNYKINDRFTSIFLQWPMFAVIPNKCS